MGAVNLRRSNDTVELRIKETYCWLLVPYIDRDVDMKTIDWDINSTEYFAIAVGRNDERFIDLKYNQYVGFIANSDYLVKIEVALKQIEEVKAAQPATSAPPQGDGQPTQKSVYSNTQSGEQIAPSVQNPVHPEQPKNTHFYLSATLDNTRINRDVQKLVEEVINHMTSVDGCKVEVSLEVNVTAPAGFPQSTVRTVSENCRTLKVKDFGFDE